MTATINSALYFSMDDKLGSITESYIADLLILEANPLMNISNTKKVKAVIKDGRYHSGGELDARLLLLDKNE